jgi:hypothetical protein
VDGGSRLATANVALSGAATASSSYAQLGPGRAVDGNPATNWAAPRSATASQPEWLTAVYLERLGSIEPDATSGLVDADRNAAFLISHPLHWEPSDLNPFSRLAI